MTGEKGVIYNLLFIGYNSIEIREPVMSMRAIIFDLDHTLFVNDKELYTGVLDLLIIVRRLGLSVAGLSNKDHRMLVRLEDTGIRHYFDHVLCADQVVEPKEPAGVLHVLAKLGVLPEETVLASHAHADILLGKDAGLVRTIGVSHGRGNDGPLAEAGADHIVENIPAILDVLG